MMKYAFHILLISFKMTEVIGKEFDNKYPKL